MKQTSASDSSAPSATVFPAFPIGNPGGAAVFCCEENLAARSPVFIVCPSLGLGPRPPCLPAPPLYESFVAPFPLPRFWPLPRPRPLCPPLGPEIGSPPAPPTAVWTLGDSVAIDSQILAESVLICACLVWRRDIALKPEAARVRDVLVEFSRPGRDEVIDVRDLGNLVVLILGGTPRQG